jgi:hypothetical protein
MGIQSGLLREAPEAATHWQSISMTKSIPTTWDRRRFAHLLANYQTGSPTREASSRSPAALPLPSPSPIPDFIPMPLQLQRHLAAPFSSSLHAKPYPQYIPQEHCSARASQCLDQGLDSCQFGPRQAGKIVRPLARGFRLGSGGGWRESAAPC